MRTQRRQIKFLERKEVEKIIKHLKGKDLRDLRDRALIEVLFSTGMRIHEALALGQKTVLEALSMPSGELAIIGKGGWQRVVFFSPSAKSAIMMYVGKKQDNGLLFPITIRCAQIMVGKRAIEAGLDKKVTPHIFRHSLATDLLRRGVDIRVVQEFLGHRSISSTQVYTHVTNSQLKTIHKKLYK